MRKDKIENLNTVTEWTETGLLEGINFGDREQLVFLFNTGKEFYSYEENEKNKGASEYLLPIIRYIFSVLKYEKNKHPSDHIEFYFLQRDKELGDQLLSRLDLKDLIGKFEYFYENFIPKIESYFKNIDGHAEMIWLFNRDYVSGMYSDYRKELKEKTV